MTATTLKTRVVEVTVTATACRIKMHWQRWYHKGSALRQKHETVIVEGVTGMEPSDDDLTRYAYAIAYWVIDPQKRHIRPLPFLRWRQVATGDDVQRTHGSEVDDRQMAMDPLPLIGGWTEPPQPSTIKTRPGRKGVSPAKRARSSPKEPTTRTLGARKAPEVLGG